jgi:tetratricopeptide (TPR) repeat protein
VLALNLAHRDLLRWSPLLPYEESKRLLESAIESGEKAGHRWLEHGHGQRADSLLAQMQSDMWRVRFQRWQSFEMGQQLEAQGRIDAAIKAYRDAADQTELRVASLYAIYHLTQISDPVTAREYLHHLITLKPATQVHWAESDYKLLGFDLDEWSVAWNGNHIPITLYWQLSEGTDVPRQWRIDDWQYIQVGDRLYQIGEVSNLLPNGGFERDLSAIAALPMGYWSIRHGRFAQSGDTSIFRKHHWLGYAEREGQITQVAIVRNITGEHGFVTPITIKDVELYLFGGWVRSTDDSEVYLGGAWEKNYERLSAWKMLDWSKHTKWHYYASVTRAPEGADSFDFRALNRGNGISIFDNVLFCHLSLPDKFNIPGEGW